MASNDAEAKKNALNSLIEEMFPEVAAERADAVEKAIRIMKEENKKLWVVTQTPNEPKGLIKRG